jgi:hypothetical protein
MMHHHIEQNIQKEPQSLEIPSGNFICNNYSYGNYQQSSKKVASFPPPPLSWDEEQDFAIGEDSDHK